MISITLKEDLCLFDNDLAEYQASDEGQEVERARQSKSPAKVKKALENYWLARNGDKGLHWSDPQAREKGRALDKYIADLYRDLN